MMRTTLRFTSVVGGVAALILLAAVILSAQDWLSTSPRASQRIAVHTSAPRALPTTASAPPTAPAPQPTDVAPPPVAPAVAVATPPPTAAVVQAASVQAPAGRPAVSMAQVAGKHDDHRSSGGHHDHGGDGQQGGDGGGDRQR